MKTFSAFLLAGVATVALAGPALADPRDDKIKALEAKLDLLASEIKELKADKTTEAQRVDAQLIDLKRTATAQYVDVQKQREQDVQVKLDNARPTLQTADGKFSLSLRSLLQYDVASYSQDNRALSGTDLSSGSLFRRARFGFQGKAFGDWSYAFQYEAGGSAIEGGTVSDAYIQYDGFKWAKFRVGAFSPPQGIDDQTGSGDLIFLERAAPSDLARGVAGSDGRKNFLGVTSYNDDYYAAVTWSGARAGDAAVFDSQQALVGRLAYRFVKSADANAQISVSGTHVLKLADTAAGPTGPSAINLQTRPENNVDGTRLIGTGNINARGVDVWGVEAAGNWKSLYGQAGYFGYAVDRRDSPLVNPSFNGWYVQGTWVLTGEARRYNAETATWQNPRPDKPFSLKNPGIGAWELTGRYSELDLDFRPGVQGATLVANTGGIRGGKQKAFTTGFNWYPNNVIRFIFNYQHVNVNRIGAAAPFGQIGQDVDILAARAQLAF